VAGRENPTNEHVVALLQQILGELKDLGVRQKRIETDLAKLAKPTAR
jgi:hypothetical protein